MKIVGGWGCGLPAFVLAFLLGAIVGFWIAGFVIDGRICTVAELRR